ncbi:MAG: hypothetical protein GX915_01330 [Clostridiales bacterium]|nr:hypothetical protein [Clostridiales bacterium]
MAITKTYNSARAKEVNKPNSNNFKSKGYKSFAKPFDKDEDEDASKRFRNSKTTDKVKEKPLEKEETIRRLEREKKVVERKKKEDVYESSEKPKHLQFKEKRAKKDLTKSYYKGLFDEDDDLL